MNALRLYDAWNVIGQKGRDAGAGKKPRLNKHNCWPCWFVWRFEPSHAVTFSVLKFTNPSALNPGAVRHLSKILLCYDWEGSRMPACSKPALERACKVWSAALWPASTRHNISTPLLLVPLVCEACFSYPGSVNVRLDWWWWWWWCFEWRSCIWFAEADNEGFISIMNPQHLFDEPLTEAKTTTSVLLPQINNGGMQNEPVQ